MHSSAALPLLKLAYALLCIYKQKLGNAWEQSGTAYSTQTSRDCFHRIPAP